MHVTPRILRNWSTLGESSGRAALLLFFPMWRQKGSNRQRNSSFTRFVPDPEFLDVHLSVVFCSVVPQRPDRSSDCPHQAPPCVGLMPAILWQKPDRGRKKREKWRYSRHIYEPFLLIMACYPAAFRQLTSQSPFQKFLRNFPTVQIVPVMPALLCGW
jgi:hypothetical protein